MAKSYIFESSKPASVKKREAKQRAAKAQETRKQRKAAGIEPTAAEKTRTRISYINQRLAKYGDPNNALLVTVPEEYRTEKGRVRSSAESRAFFAQNPWQLDRLAAQIRKHPVSNAVRDQFESMLGSIYDQVQEIGSELFYKIVGHDFQQNATADSDTDEKMLEVMKQWQERKALIPEYYEQQIRSGRLTAFSDDKMPGED